MIVSSMPKFRYPNYGDEENDTSSTFDHIETASVMFFTIEYIVRVACCSAMSEVYITGSPFLFTQEIPWSCFTESQWVHLRKICYFVSKPMNIIDVIAILPWYLEFGEGLGVNLTIFRVARLLRLVKLFKGNTMIPLVMTVAGRAAYLIIQVAAILALFMVFMACVIFLCEQGDYNEETGKFERDNMFGEKEETPFTSIFISFWWVVVTFTTVGYGDLVPTTVAGRIAGSCGIMLNLVLFAVPITIVTTIFMDEYNRQTLDGKYNDLYRAVVKYEGEKLSRLVRKEANETFAFQETRTNFFPNRGNFFARLFYLFEDFKSATLSRIVQTIVNIMIILSALSLMIESLPKYRYPEYGEKEGDSAPEFQKIEVVCVICFSVELFTRMLTVWFVPAAGLRRCGYRSPTHLIVELTRAIFDIPLLPRNMKDSDKSWLNGLKWLVNKHTLIDICSTLPLYIQSFVALPSLGFLRVLRLLRMVRVLRLAKSAKGVIILSDAISRSMEALMSLSVLFIAWIVFASSIMFYCEQGKWNPSDGRYERGVLYGATEETPFQSIPSTLWWMIVTLTTVGYGDMYPTTLAGRSTGVFILFFSVISLAVPIAVVGVNLEKANKEYVFLHREDGRARVYVRGLSFHSRIAFVRWYQQRAKKHSAIMEGKVSRSHLSQGNPSVEFFDDIARRTGNIEDNLGEIQKLIRYHSNFLRKSDSVLRKQVKSANLTLVPSCITDSKKRFERIAEKLDITLEQFKYMQNYHAKIWNNYCQSQRHRGFFNKALRTEISKRTCFVFWLQHVQSMRKKNSQKANDFIDYKHTANRDVTVSEKDRASSQQKNRRRREAQSNGTQKRERRRSSFFGSLIGFRNKEHGGSGTTGSELELTFPMTPQQYTRRHLKGTPSSKHLQNPQTESIVGLMDSRGDLVSAQPGEKKELRQHNHTDEEDDTASDLRAREEKSGERLEPAARVADSKCDREDDGVDMR
eukprot:jgi/Bigna1/82352/fgenesh1_pg.91_\